MLALAAARTGRVEDKDRLLIVNFRAILLELEEILMLVVRVAESMMYDGDSFRIESN